MSTCKANAAERESAVPALTTEAGASLIPAHAPVETPPQLAEWEVHAEHATALAATLFQSRCSELVIDLDQVSGVTEARPSPRADGSRPTGSVPGGGD